MRIGRARLGVAVSAAVLISMSGMASAQAAGQAEWGWNTTHGSTVDGISSVINPNSFGPTPHSCVLFSAVAGDTINGGSRQLEAGVVRCGSEATIDGNCGPNSSVTNFVETYIRENQPQYRCYAASAGSVNESVEFQTRQVDDGTDYGGFVAGTLYAQLGPLSKPNVFIWGEATGVAGCTGWSGGAIFRQTQFYQRGVGYHHIATFPFTSTPDNCWSSGGWDGTAGSEHIFRT